MNFKEYLDKNITFILTVFEALISFAIMLLWGAVKFPTGMITHRETILYNHTSTAFSLTAGGIVFDHVMGNTTPYQLVMTLQQLVYSCLGAILYGAVLVIQIINFTFDHSQAPKLMVTMIFHLVAVIIFSLTTLSIITVQRFPMPKKEIYRQPRFVLRIIIAILLMLIDVLWAFLRFPGGKRDFSTLILFAYGPPAYLIIFWGMMIGYCFGVEPSAVLVITWESVGIGVFLTIGGLQIAFMTVLLDKEHIVQIGAMVFLDLFVGFLLMIDIILTNKDIIHIHELENEVPLSKIK